MNATCKPSDIVRRIPFTGWMGKVEAEYVASVIVLFLVEHGDTWNRPFKIQDVGEWAFGKLERGELDADERALVTNPFIDPAVGADELLKRGYVSRVRASGLASADMLQATAKFAEMGASQ